MKTIILSLLITLVTSCSKDNAKQDPIAQLPPETQIGANTFGVTIRGKVYIPRDPTGVNVGATSKGMYFWKSPDDQHSFDEIEVVDGASPIGFKIIIHLQNFYTNGVGIYPLLLSNFHNGIDSSSHTHIYFKIWDSTISNYAYYGSLENLGEVINTRHSNGIVSGTFKGKFVRYDNPNDFITITDGRFDFNTATLSNHTFP